MKGVGNRYKKGQRRCYGIVSFLLLFDKRIILYMQFAGKILYKASDLERMLEEK